MPIYEYLCENCAYKFEVKQSMKDDPVTACERCGKPVQRLISSPAIMFKGSGWYITDYSDKMKPPTDGEKKDASNGEKKDSTTSATSSATPAPAGAPSGASASTPTSPPATSPTTAPSPSATPSSSSDK